MNEESARHRLFVDRIGLVGGRREVHFNAGLNLVTGPISTGKTTLVRLIEVALSVTPSGLPPETAMVRAIELEAQLGTQQWGVYRPLVSTADATVSVAEIGEGENDPVDTAVSLPARGFEGSYSRFMLDRLALPAVAIPESGTTGNPRLNPVSMTDFLSYCIIRGEDLDSDVFGHDHPFRDIKRRFVFRLVYGLHNPELTELEAEAKALRRDLDALDTEDVTITRFLSGTPFSGSAALVAELDAREQLLAEVEAEERQLRVTAEHSSSEISTLRVRALDYRADRDAAVTRIRDLDIQIHSLAELERQLISQSARLTRAIVADEWLVDFEFVVCPRCGTDVTPEAAGDVCYLCHQTPAVHAGRDSLIAEQSRVATQIEETQHVRQSRERSRDEARAEADAKERALSRVSRDLDRASGRYVSDRASDFQRLASRRSRLETEMEKLLEYSELFERRADRASERARLSKELTDVEERATLLRVRSAAAEQRIQALERRMLFYLESMRVPSLGDLLTVKINRTTFLPEISGRTFDELSSQGLKTLVNVAHALAHHTIAIDQGLPLPGLLVLDGISANTGHEGFDQARIDDAYRLLSSEAAKYEDYLQVIVVDNTIPTHLFDGDAPIALTLSHDDRLIRSEE